MPMEYKRSHTPSNTWATFTDDSRDGRAVTDNPSIDLQGSVLQFDFSCSSSSSYLQAHLQTCAEPEVFVAHSDAPSQTSTEPEVFLPHSYAPSQTPSESEVALPHFDVPKQTPTEPEVFLPHFDVPTQTPTEPEVALPNSDVPTAASDDSTLLACAVCSDVASGRYFGATVCLPCKSFYIRCTKEGQPVFSTKCRGGCDVTKLSRIHCQSCRYQKCLSVGMARKEKPVYIKPVEGQYLCAVCGDLANGVHFGVYTCEGCKKFFRRGMLEYSYYQCKKNNLCTINPRSRNTCRSCRYRKCINVGMSRQAIKMGRPKKRVMSLPEISGTSGNHSDCQQSSSTVRTVQYKSRDALPPVQPLTYSQSMVDIRGHQYQSKTRIHSVGSPSNQDGSWSPNHPEGSLTPKTQEHQWISGQGTRDSTSEHEVEQWIRNHNDDQWPHKDQGEPLSREHYDIQWMLKHNWTPNHQDRHWPHKHTGEHLTSKNLKAGATVMNLKPNPTLPFSDTTCGHTQMETEEVNALTDNNQTDIEMNSSPGPVSDANEAISYCLTNDDISSMLQILEGLGKMEQTSDTNHDDSFTRRLERCCEESKHQDDRSYKSDTSPKNDTDSDGNCRSHLNEDNRRINKEIEKNNSSVCCVSSPEQPKSDVIINHASSTTLHARHNLLAAGHVEEPDSSETSPRHRYETTKCHSPGVFTLDNVTGAPGATTPHSVNTQSNPQLKSLVRGKWHPRVEENYHSPSGRPILTTVPHYNSQSSSRIHPEYVDLRYLYESSKTLQVASDKYYGSNANQCLTKQLPFGSCTCDVSGQISDLCYCLKSSQNRTKPQNGERHQYLYADIYPYRDCLNALQSIKDMECLASAPGILSSAVRQLTDTAKILLLYTKKQLTQRPCPHSQELSTPAERNDDGWAAKQSYLVREHQGHFL